MRQRLVRIESRNAGVVVTVSDPSVERPISDAHVLCPGWNQSPTHGCEVANLFALFFEDNQDWLRWRNVVSRMLFNFIIRRLKPFSKVLLRVRQSVSVTHTFILSPHQRHRPRQGCFSSFFTSLNLCFS